MGNEIDSILCRRQTSHYVAVLFQTTSLVNGWRLFKDILPDEVLWNEENRLLRKYRIEKQKSQSFIWNSPQLTDSTDFRLFPPPPPPKKKSHSFIRSFPVPENLAEYKRSDLFLTQKEIGARITLFRSDVILSNFPPRSSFSLFFHPPVFSGPELVETVQ